MPRNKTFISSHEPFHLTEALHIKHDLVSGPLSFFNPTRAHFSPRQLSRPHGSPNHTLDKDADSSGDGEKEQPASDIEFKWRSRDNRKGRHTLMVQPATDRLTAKYLAPESTNTLRAVLKGIGRMFTEYPYWDVSYLVATIFTLGSVVWVINGFFSFLPLVQPSTEFPTEILYGGGITAFIGATIFEFGSILLMVEAVNEDRSGCFGWALENALEGEDGKMRVRADKEGCRHHHTNRKNFIGKPSAGSISAEISSRPRTSTEHGEKSESLTEGQKAWTWFPSWHELTTHYFREIGFLASLAQTIGATVFWISGFTALPGIQNVIGSQGLLDGIYWVPQIVGGSGFIVSGILFLLETQKKWYLPAWDVLGWHIAFWNLIGGIGFTLCGALGPAYNSEGALYQASLSTFWGSWAFLIGSLIQWYESLDTHPVEEQKKEK